VQVVQSPLEERKDDDLGATILSQHVADRADELLVLGVLPPNALGRDEQSLDRCKLACA
jgi:hypothetical protein